MKGFRSLCLGYVGLFIILAIGINGFLFVSKQSQNHFIQVEINRIIVESQRQLGSSSQEQMRRWFSENKGEHMTSVTYLSLPASQEKVTQMFQGVGAQGQAFQVRELMINGNWKGLVRLEYKKTGENIALAQKVSNGLLVLFFLGGLGMMWLLYRKIVKPFQQLSALPYELAKGRFQTKLKQDKSGYFQKYLWGMDMLRVSLQDGKSRENALEKEKKMMILSISHDIKTPLSAIRLYSKALNDQLYPQEEKRKEIYGKIDEKAVQIENMVKDIMETSTNDACHFQLKKEDFYLKEVVDYVDAHYREQCQLRHLDFQIHFRKDRLLTGDYDRLLEVVENVMENALKYGDGRYLHLEFVEEEYRQLIRITNSGCPIKGMDMMHMFDQFWRGENGADKPGSGLGLYISKKIMNQMGGEIFPEKSGEDFTMTIVLPG